VFYIFYLTLLDLTTMSNHVNAADMAGSVVSSADDISSSPVMDGDATPSNTPLGGASPSSSSVTSSTAKPSKSLELLNNSGMGDLKSSKPYKREPLHRFVTVLISLLNLYSKCYKYSLRFALLTAHVLAECASSEVETKM